LLRTGRRRRASREDEMTTKTIEWLHDVEQALGESRRANKPVLLDFSAAPM